MNINLADLFYLTATIVLILVGILAIYITYQLYLLRTFAIRNLFKVRQTLTSVSLARYSIQGALLKTIVGILGGGEKR